MLSRVQLAYCEVTTDVGIMAMDKSSLHQTQDSGLSAICNICQQWRMGSAMIELQCQTADNITMWPGMQCCFHLDTQATIKSALNQRTNDQITTNDTIIQN